MSHRLHVALISFRQVHFTSNKSAYQNLRLGAQGEAWPRHWSAMSCGS